MQLLTHIIDEGITVTFAATQNVLKSDVQSPRFVTFWGQSDQHWAQMQI